MGIKIAVIGAGSSYTPELFSNLVDTSLVLDVERVVLMDIDGERASFIAQVSRKLLAGKGKDIQIVATSDRRGAIAEADFIILQIRVGGLAGRIRDEKLPMEFGLVGNETTGAGGFISALRTLQVVLDIARDVERYAPHAWLMNLSNPAGIITEALLKHSQVRVIGFCNIPINTQYAFAEALGVPAASIRLDSFGLNHLSWVREVYVAGEAVLQPLIKAAYSRESALYQHGLVESLIDPSWLQTLRMIPGWYLRYYYYPEAILNEDRLRPRSDGEDDLLAEQKLHQIYSTEGYHDDARQILADKGGAQYYLPVLQTIESIVNDRGDVIICDVRNGGTLSDLPPNACVEVPARIYREGVESLTVGPMPEFVRGLVQSVKAYEELTIQAAINGDPRLAVAALATNPLVGSVGVARAFFERALVSEGPTLRQFLSR